MKLNAKTVVTIAVISALTSVALGHLSSMRKG